MGRFRGEVAGVATDLSHSSTIKVLSHANALVYITKSLVVVF